MKKILLIEDNEQIRNNTAEILELSNYQVVTAPNGKLGVEKALTFNPDLILCDIMMPELDGFGVLHAIHKNDSIKNTPFIFLTAKTNRADLRKGMELGADDYITKPFSGIELLNAVESRLKKIDQIKSEVATGRQEAFEAELSAFGTDVLSNFIKDRNINKYKKKQLIYSEGNHPGKLYYVVNGKVKAFKSNYDGKELVVDLYRTGDFLGYVALLEGKPYTDTAQAMEETQLAIIPKEDFDELIFNNREVAQKFIELLAHNVTEKEEHLLGLAYNSLRKKVAEALLLLQQKYQNDTNEVFEININRESLATIAGTAKESLIRTLSDFKTEKLVDINKDGSIKITNQKKLELLRN